MIRLDNVPKSTTFLLAAGALVAADRLTWKSGRRSVGLVGPNGAGKTTTLKMICGLMLPTATHHREQYRCRAEPEEVQQYIGYLADFFSVYDDLKTREYVEHFARAYKLDASKIPARVREVIAVLGLETKYDAFVGGLSRGMKQRLGIARAIVTIPASGPREPASGLDPKARLELKDLIRRLHREGKTIFITSHVLSDLEEICTSLAIMEKGKLLRVGKLPT